MLQLVESYRNAEGQPRQNVVVSLGDARLPEGEEKIIAKAVEAFAKGERELLATPLSEKGQWWVDHVCKMIGRSAKKLEERRKGVFNGVISDKVGSENVVELGPEAVGMKAWNELGLDTVLEECGMNRSRRATAALLCVNRLTAPLSELGVAEWTGTTALAEMLKGTLGLRPNYHQKEQRVDGHVFITLRRFWFWILSSVPRTISSYCDPRCSKSCSLRTVSAYSGFSATLTFSSGSLV